MSILSRLTGDTVLVGGAIVALLLVFTNVYYGSENARLTHELSQGQREINDGLRLSRINTQVVRAIAGLAATDDDAQLRDLLMRHGISIQQTAAVEAEPVDG